MFVAAPVSSTNFSRAGSSAGCSSRHRARRAATSGRSCSAARSCFFLGRQSWLEQLFLQLDEEGLGIAAEAPALHPPLPAGLQLPAQLLTPTPVRPRQLRRAEVALARRRRCQQPGLASQYQPRRGPPPAAGAPLAVAVAAEELLQVVIGPR